MATLRVVHDGAELGPDRPGAVTLEVTHAGVVYEIHTRMTDGALAISSDLGNPLVVVPVASNAIQLRRGQS